MHSPFFPLRLSLQTGSKEVYRVVSKDEGGGDWRVCAPAACLFIALGGWVVNR